MEDLINSLLHLFTAGRIDFPGNPQTWLSLVEQTIEVPKKLANRNSSMRFSDVQAPCPMVDCDRTKSAEVFDQSY